VEGDYKVVVEEDTLGDFDMVGKVEGFDMAEEGGAYKNLVFPNLEVEVVEVDKHLVVEDTFVVVEAYMYLYAVKGTQGDIVVVVEEGN